MSHQTKISRASDLTIDKILYEQKYWDLRLYQWFTEYGEHLISSNNIERFKALLPNGKVFHYIHKDKDFLTLQYNEYD